MLIKSNKAKKWINYVIIILIGLFSFAVTYSLSLYNIDPHHSGFMYKTAWDVAHGQIIYKETYTQYGCLFVYLQAFAILLFGEHIWAIHLVTSIFYALSYILVYAIVKSMSTHVIAIATVIITILLAPFYFWTFHPWSSVFSLFFLLLTLYGFIKYIETTKHIWIILAGISTACTFWCRQSVGLVVGLASFLILLFLQAFYKKYVGLQSWAKYWGSFLGVMLLFIGLLALQGALKDWWIQNIQGMVNFGTVKNNEDSGGMLGKLLGCLFPYRKMSEVIWTILPCLTLMLFAIAGVKLILKKLDEKEVKWWLMAFSFDMFSLASWHQYYPVLCFRHVFWSAFPMIGVILCFAYRGLHGVIKQNKYVYLVILLIIIPLFYSPIIYRLKSWHDKVQNEYDKITNDTYMFMDNLKLTKEECIFYNDLFAEMELLKKRYPNRNVINMTSEGLFACFSEKNFHPQFSNMGTTFYQDYFEDLYGYIYTAFPIIIGYASQNFEGYNLYHVIEGDSGDIYMNQSYAIFLPNEIQCSFGESFYRQEDSMSKGWQCSLSK